jgi:hypothetical protein
MMDEARQHSTDQHTNLKPSSSDAGMQFTQTESSPRMTTIHAGEWHEPVPGCGESSYAKSATTRMKSAGPVHQSGCMPV